MKFKRYRDKTSLKVYLHGTGYMQQITQSTDKHVRAEMFWEMCDQAQYEAIEYLLGQRLVDVKDPKNFIEYLRRLGSHRVMKSHIRMFAEVTSDPNAIIDFLVSYRDLKLAVDVIIAVIGRLEERDA